MTDILRRNKSVAENHEITYTTLSPHSLLLELMFQACISFLKDSGTWFRAPPSTKPIIMLVLHLHMCKSIQHSDHSVS